MDDQEQRWNRVEAAITARMAQLTLSQADVVRASGLSAETIRPIRTGVPGNYRPATLARLARALLWPHHAIVDILNGADWRSFDVLEKVPDDPIELSFLARYIRTERGLPPDQAAEAAGIPLHWWIEVERGHYSDVPLNELDKILKWGRISRAKYFPVWPPPDDRDTVIDWLERRAEIDPSRLDVPDDEWEPRPTPKDAPIEGGPWATVEDVAEIKAQLTELRALIVRMGNAQGGPGSSP